MAASSSAVGRSCIYRRMLISTNACETTTFDLHAFTRTIPKRRAQPFTRRAFTCGRSLRREQNQKAQEAYTARLGKAWRQTKIEWKPIPIGLGIAFLGFVQFLRVQARESPGDGSGAGEERPPKRERIRPSGPWQVQVMSTLPLKMLSRIWGRFNELHIPYYLRVPGFKLYGWIFGVNWDEVGEDDLHVYPNLASFFYRTLKPGVRPLDPNMNAILSPADGRVLQFGTIEDGEVEQVKGMTYKLDALLGNQAPPGTSANPALPSNIVKSNIAQSQLTDDVKVDAEFANINGISYTLPNLFSGQHTGSSWFSGSKKSTYDSTTPRPSSELAVGAELAKSSSWWSPLPPSAPSKLYYLVVYLAPGDYHRFHSPVSWVCASRRHFAGELYSVSPYLQRMLPNLFVLNERVVLLGRWKYGFFSYTAVGATNVGSIKINFDKELRTNSLVVDTEADRQAQAAKERGETYSGYSEASYEGASKILGGYALKRGDEMGGFQLGSSIVLVFEAPAGGDGERRKQQVNEEDKSRGGWKWNVEKAQRVKMGQALGWVEEG